MTPEELLAQAQSQAQELQTSFQNFQANRQVPVGVMEKPQPALEIPQVVVDPAPATGAATASQRFLEEQQAAAQSAQAAEQEQVSAVRELQQQFLGRGVEQLELEQDAGLSGQREDLADLMTRITSATDDLTAFDDDTFLGEEALRGEASQRDLTKGKFGAQARERRLQRAIDRTGQAAKVRTLMASAQMQQNNITAAQSEINRALDLKYGVVEQALQFETQFLNRASEKAEGARRGQLDARKAVVAQQEQNVRDAKQMVNTAVQIGANPAEIEAVMQIENPQDQAIAAQGIIARAAYRQRSREETLQDISIASASADLAMKQFGLQEAQDIAAARKEALLTGNIPLDGETRDTAFKVIDDYEAALKQESITDLVGSYAKIQASTEDPSAAGDLALIFNYMKMLDPGSVVREGEFANAQNAAGIPTRIQAQYNNIVRGERLTPAQRTDFLGQSAKIYDTAVSAKKRIDNTFKERSGRFGVPADVVLRDISVAETGDIEFGIIPDQQADTFLQNMGGFSLSAQSTGLISQ